MVDYLIGVDGGGTTTRAVVASTRGHVLGRGEAGPSALGQGIAQAWRHVLLAVLNAFDDAGHAAPRWGRCAMAAGLSGVNHAPWRQAFIAADPGFGWLEAETDSYVLLLGAHGGRPGVIVIAGTGSVAEALRPDGHRVAVGGWGFPVGDEGSGAWLGMAAVRHAQAVLDGRARGGALARAVHAQCGADRAALQAWSTRATQFRCAQVAPLVFEAAVHDRIAEHLLSQAAADLDALARAADPTARLPVVVWGSVGRRLLPRLGADLRRRVVEPAGDAAAGALVIARRALQAQDAREAVAG
jgi:glucosamine kinase